MSDKVTVSNVILGLIGVFALYSVIHNAIKMHQVQMKTWRIVVISLMTAATWAWVLLPCGGYKALGLKDCPSTFFTVTAAVLFFVLTITLEIVFARAEYNEGNPNFQPLFPNNM